MHPSKPHLTSRLRLPVLTLALALGAGIGLHSVRAEPLDDVHERALQERQVQALGGRDLRTSGATLPGST